VTERPPPFIGASRVPWLRPLAQVLRVVALGIGASTSTAAGWTVPDVAVAVVLVAFVAWRAAPPGLIPVRLRDVMALEVVLTTLGVVVTGGWGSPWLAAQFVPIGLAALGLPPASAALLAIVTAVLDTAASLPIQQPGLELVSRAATLALVVGFAVITRGVMTGSRVHQDEALGRLEVLWSVRAMLQGLHTEAIGTPVTFQVDEAIETLRLSSDVLGAVDVVGLFALEQDGTLRCVHGIGLPTRTYRVRDLPGPAGQPRRDGEPVGVHLPAGGMVTESQWGAYLWLPVGDQEREHVLVVEHAEDDPSVDAVLPELAGIAEPLAVTVYNATWFNRVSHLGVDEERQRIAARLHDQFAQQLAVVSMQLEMAARRHPEDEDLRALRVEVRDSLTGLRDTMVELRATVDEDHPLEHVLVALVDRLRQRHGVVAELEHDVAGTPLPSTVGQQLLRMTQELTRRAVEERGAIAVYVRYLCDDEHAQLRVSDDGEPPDDEPQQAIAQVVRDRAESVGATVDTVRSADGLSTVTITVERTDRTDRTDRSDRTNRTTT
jgi:signal transduction histidine kinase